MNYDLELDRVISKIKEDNAKLVCIQLPDGLKPEAAKIQEEIERNTDATVVIWGGSCYGGCDVPDLSRMKVDLLVQWGHTVFKKTF